MPWFLPRKGLDLNMMMSLFHTKNVGVHGPGARNIHEFIWTSFAKRQQNGRIPLESNLGKVLGGTLSKHLTLEREAWSACFFHLLMWLLCKKVLSKPHTNVFCYGPRNAGKSFSLDGAQLQQLAISFLCDQLVDPTIHLKAGKWFIQHPPGKRKLYLYSLWFCVFSA